MNRVAKEKSHPGTAIGKWKNKWNLVINSLTFSTVTKPELRWIRWKKRQGINGNLLPDNTRGTGALQSSQRKAGKSQDWSPQNHTKDRQGSASREETGQDKKNKELK